MNRTWSIAVVCLLVAACGAWAASAVPPASQPAPVVAPAPAPAPNPAPVVAPAPAPSTAPVISPTGTKPASTGPAPATKAVEPTPATKAAEPPPTTKPVEPPPATKPVEPPPPTTKAAEPPKPPAKKLDALAHGKTITAVPDQEIIVELKGTTETPWTLTKVDGTSLEQVGKVEFKPKKEGDKEGVYTATFKAVKEGKTTVLLEGTMIMDGGKKQKMEVKFSVTVAAAG